MRVLISAGEASGEMYGAGLLEALQRLAATRPEIGTIECFGLGGERMRAAGCETVVDAREVAVVGIFEVLSHLPTIYRRFHDLVREAERRRPDVAVLIDFPDFNFRLAKELHKRGIPVVYYVSPQLWAWRSGRVALVKKYVTKMLPIFPFEEAWYRERGVDAEFVGHPLGSVQIERRENPGRIALLPGSRRKELAMNLPVLLRAAAELGEGYEYCLPVASTLDRPWVEAQIATASAGLDQQPKIMFTDDARSTLASSRAAVVASGTATVEAAIIGTPFVMVYRLAPLTFKLGRRLVNVPFYAMPNLIVGRQVVPELVQDDFTPGRVVTELRKILNDGPDRERMLSGLAEVRQRLRGESADAGAPFDRAATAVMRTAMAAKVR